MIKNILIVTTLIFSISLLACDISIPRSFKDSFLSPPYQGFYPSCSSEETCDCIDGINPWFAEFVDNHYINSGTKRDAYLAAQAAEEQLQAAMAQARKAQACGKDTMAYLLVRNAQKQLSTAQVKQLVEAYATIKSLLESGSLTTAKEEISAAVADGVIVTEADKTALNAFIDECKP